MSIRTEAQPLMSADDALRVSTAHIKAVSNTAIRELGAAYASGSRAIRRLRPPLWPATA